MTIHIALEVSDDLLEIDPWTVTDPPRTDDELTSVLAAVCRVLEATGKIRFRVGGFGDPTWPVDVGTDLAIIIAQVPDVRFQLRTDGSHFSLNFYEQGIERYLSGRRQGTEITWECSTMHPTWTPFPPIEVMSLIQAEEMLRELCRSFCRAVEVVCPSVANGTIFREWMTSLRL